MNAGWPRLPGDEAHGVRRDPAAVASKASQGREGIGRELLQRGGFP